MKISTKKILTKNKNRRYGFTVIELLVIAPVVILTIGTFVTVIVGLTGDVLASRGATTAAYNIQDSLNRIDQDVKLSSSFLATNNVTLTSPQGYDNSTASFKNANTTTGTMLILNAYATTGNPLIAGSGLVYNNTPNSCGSSAMAQNSPQTLNIIYFVKSGTLWRRVVTSSNYLDTTNTWCSIPWQQPSCTPGYILAFCKTQDIQLATGLGTTGFSVQYFNSGNTAAENTAASDVSASDTSRGSALQTATTISVALNSSQTIAGRPVSQSGTLRSTRLDSNASTIATTVTPTIPSTPVVTGSYTAPTTASFSWPSSTGGGIVNYILDYSLNNGSSWTNNAMSNHSSTSFIVPGTTHSQKVMVRVSSNNSAGTSGGSGTASVTIPLWVTPLLINNWVDYGANNYSTTGYTITSSGVVLLKGLVKGGSGVIFTLPTGYRPGAWLLFQNSSNNAAGRLDIGTDGTVNMSVGNNAWFSLDGISFMPSGNTFNDMSSGFLNGWKNYSPASGDSRWANAGYFQDTSGRVRLQGLVYAGTSTDGTAITSFPTALQPSGYEHVSNDNSNSAGLIAVNNSGGRVDAKGGSNVYVGMNALFYPSTYSGWTSLTLQNSWIYYGAPFSTPRYTKSTDGMVLLKGLISAGTVASGTVIATLPAGYCPKQQLLTTTVAGGAWASINILPGSGSGCNVIVGAASATWTSLDSISYMGEW
jgi:hypothetical protein